VSLCDRLTPRRANCGLEALDKLEGAIKVFARLLLEARQQRKHDGFHGWAQRTRIEVEKIAFEEVEERRADGEGGERQDGGKSGEVQRQVARQAIIADDRKYITIDFKGLLVDA